MCNMSRKDFFRTVDDKLIERVRKLSIVSMDATRTGWMVNPTLIQSSQFEYGLGRVRPTLSSSIL